MCIRNIHRFDEKKASCEEKCPVYKIPEIPKPIESNVCGEWKPEVVKLSTNESHIANGHVSTAMLCAQRLCDKNLVRCNLATVHEDESCEQACEEIAEEEKPKKCPKKKKKKRIFLKIFLPLLFLSILGLVILCPDDEDDIELNNRLDNLNANENDISETTSPESTINNK